MLPSSSLCVCGPLSSSSRRSVRTVVAQSGQMRSFLPLPRSRHELAGRAAGHRNGHPQAPQFPCRGINPPSSSVTSLMRSAGFPEHESVHSATADKSRWGLPCFSGRIERNGGEDLTSCSGCGSGCCDERERESLRLAPLISARRSDTRSVDLQCTRSCRHAPQCEKQRRPQCDSSADAECHPLLEGLRAAPEARSDE